MIKIINENFSIQKICESGQCFRFNPIGENKYALTAFGRYLEMEQEKDGVILHCTQEELQEVWYGYFDLGTDYNCFIECVPEEDEYLKKAVQYGKGIRILKQDTWEMIISFIISQQNNIRRIKKCIELLCERFGEKKVHSNGGVYYDFPSPAALAAAAEDELKDCNLGYRSRYVRNTANSIWKGEVDISGLKLLPYAQAKEELLKLSGVGNKVADCICLFGLYQKDAFPVDTHIQKVLRKYYPNQFPFALYTGYEGVIQQYIFYYDLKEGKRDNNRLN